MIGDENARTWQLVMTGDGLHRVTPQAQADMARLFNLDPSVSHLTVEVGDGRIHVARDWPSDHRLWRVRDRRPCSKR